MRTFTLFLLVLVSTAINAQQIINVHPDSMYSTIQAGINAATDGDMVLVAEGTYNEQINFMGKAITVASHYYLDGNPEHISNTILDGNLLPSGNSSLVLFVSGEDTNSIINGFTIQHGRGTLDGTFMRGGGIYINNAGAKIMNNRIIQNTLDVSAFHENYNAGGSAVATNANSYENWVVLDNNTIDDNHVVTDYLDGGSVVYSCIHTRLANNIITNNSVSITGTGIGFGAVMVQSVNGINPPYFYSKFIAVNNIIKYNSVSSEREVFGGGMWCYGVEGNIRGNDISENETITQYSKFGGAGFFINNAKTMIIDGNYFVGNNASQRGGALQLLSGNNSDQPAIIQNNTFNGNHAGEGGGAVYTNKQVVIRNNRFEENTSVAEGGAVRFSVISYATSTMENNIFLKNKGGIGGAIYTLNTELVLINNVFDRNEALTGEGGAIALSKGAYPFTNTKLINNSFSGNKATLKGGAIYSLACNPEILNTIFFNDSAQFGPEINVDYGIASVAYSNLDTTKIQGQIDLYEGMMFTNPLFCDTTCLMPLCWSPCLNMGISEYIFGSDTLTAPLTDLNGAVRPLEDAYDLGAYEIDYSGIGVKKIENDFDISAYPNPFNSRLYCHYRLENESPVTVTIFNILGSIQSTWHQVQGPGEYNTPFELGMLQKGIYLLKLQIGDYSFTRKVVRNE